MMRTFFFIFSVSNTKAGTVCKIWVFIYHGIGYWIICHPHIQYTGHGQCRSYVSRANDKVTFTTTCVLTNVVSIAFDIKQ